MLWMFGKCWKMLEFVFCFVLFGLFLICFENVGMFWMCLDVLDVLKKLFFFLGGGGFV